MSPSSVIEHFRLRRYLDAHADAELAGDLAERVAVHVRTCGRCRRHARLTAVIKRRLARLSGRPGIPS